MNEAFVILEPKDDRRSRSPHTNIVEKHFVIFTFETEWIQIDFERINAAVCHTNQETIS